MTSPGRPTAVLAVLSLIAFLPPACSAREDPGAPPPDSPGFACDGAGKNGWKRCRGSLVLWCHGTTNDPHFHVERDCEALGLECRDLGEVPPRAACVDPNQRCDAGLGECRGAVAVSCAGGVVALEPCGSTRTCVVSGGVAACERPPPGDAGDAGCDPELDGEVVGHGCFHATGGPFLDVDPNAQPPAEVASFHGALRFLEPTREGAALAYTARHDRLLAAFHGEAASVTVGATTPLLGPTRVPCAPLPRVSVYELPQGTHELVLRGFAPGDLLVLEVLSPEDVRRACADPDGGTGDGGDANASDARRDTDSPEASDGDVAVDTGSEHPGTADAAAEAPDARCAPPGAGCSAATPCCQGECAAGYCPAPQCRSEGPCEHDHECCAFCHFTETPHCH